MNNAIEPIVIPLSKTKVVGFILGALLMTAASIFAIMVVRQTPFPPLLVIGAGIAGTIFFGTIFVWSMVKICDKKPGLVIDSQGIIDNASSVAAGRILWSEIKAIEVREMSGQKFLAIHVEDPGKYAKRGHSIQRSISTMNWKYFGTPVNITARGLQMEFSQLKALMEEQWSRHSAAHRRESLDESKASEYLGKTVLIGVTYLDHQGHATVRRQWHGTITEVSNARGIVITLKNDTNYCALPPDFSLLTPAKPGEYRLHSTGEMIRDPDLLATWIRKAPKPEESGRADGAAGRGDAYTPLPPQWVRADTRKMD